ncbi:cupin domain-containing protein [Tetragenococcus halophilus]|uniref:cupin domain-containing protein n=1 Tax=Tetragenococcus halophilus TaxID=51669 RepID=UPI00077C178E|nr:cupin domain-containing protein [Tetragenococcus halophilus]MCF1602000.1 cupin domain-containing protein [Tetragenococcus halophilus]MCO8288982.1 cupin domain-containing protein [Tetragenococcus halophilus]MDN6723272.1 cupin domain-containing protein [Tetragenococcus halophilus]
MAELDRDMIENIVRQIVNEKLMSTKHIDISGVTSVKLAELDVSEEDRLDTGKPGDIVYTKDLFSLTESPRLGCGLMVMKDTTFDWELGYDEIDYIISGRLDVIIDGRTVSAEAGEIVLIPSGSKIQFSVTGDARFIYVTYPADWQG